MGDPGVEAPGGRLWEQVAYLPQEPETGARRGEKSSMPALRPTTRSEGISEVSVLTKLTARTAFTCPAVSTKGFWGKQSPCRNANQLPLRGLFFKSRRLCRCLSGSEPHTRTPSRTPRHQPPGPHTQPHAWAAPGTAACSAPLGGHLAPGRRRCPKQLRFPSTRNQACTRLLSF